MKNSFLKHCFTVFIIVVALCTSNLSISLAVGTAQTQAAAKQLADCLHEVFERNLGFNHLQKLYDSLSCANEDIDLSKLLYSITEPAAARLNVSRSFLKDLVKKVQPLSSETQKLNSTSTCCRQMNDTNGSTHFNDKFRSVVDLTTACSIAQSTLQKSSRLNSELLNGFRRNFNKSPVVAWQYYGSIDGEYVQYPASTRYCDGNTSQFDPRFKSWYVETASPVKKNLVIIIDRSGSMSGPRMRLAIDAARTVLDTLSPQDNVGILAFSHRIQTPSGCFGTSVASGIPANLAKLKQWVRQLRALGSTFYAKAFKHAFSMFQNVTRNQGSQRSNIILFLTDGNPNDVEAGIYQAIDEGQARMNHTVQINTYALGTGISTAGLQRLQTIAYSNGGVFFEIKDQQSGVLKRTMGSYYTSIKTPLEQEPRLLVPYIDSRLGLIVTMSLALIQNETFRGVLALDLPLERLFKEALQVSSVSKSYAILVDKEGRTILHPSLPDPSDTTSRRSFLPVSMYESGLRPDVILSITGGGTGQRRFKAGFPVPLGDQTTDGTHILYTNATYLWSPVTNSGYFIVLVVADGQSARSDLTSFRGTSQISSTFYHRLDLSWNGTHSHPKDICSLTDNLLISPVSSTVKIAPVAFNDSDKYIYMAETLKDVQHIQRFFNDNTFKARYKGLSEAVRAEVVLTSELEQIWQTAEVLSPDVVTWRFVGTQQGVLKTYPGVRLQKTYSHQQQSWYRAASSSPETLVLSLKTSAYQQHKMLSLSKAVFKNSCRSGQRGDVLAVMGLEMTKSSFLQLITDNIDLNKEANMDWYVLERSGYILLNFSSSTTTLQSYKKHLIEVMPWLANELIKNQNTLKASWCNDYQQHTVEMFYELLDSNGVYLNSSDPCRQFTITTVQGTSLFLIGVPSRSVHRCTDSSVTPNKECFCGKTCDVCSNNATFNCQCPCSCHMSYDECDNSVTRLWTSSPCPVSAPPLFDTEKEEVALQDALAILPRCARDCVTIENITECEKTFGCHWCLNKEIPSCSSECKTGQSLSMHILFPCQNFLNLSALQQNTVKYLFKQGLLRLVPSLSALNLGILHLQKDAIVFRLYATTSNSDLKTLQENIQQLVNQSKIVLGPVRELPEIYTARGSEQFTDLQISFTLEPALPQTSQKMTTYIQVQLQSILMTLLGKSHVSRVRRLNINKTSVQFSLSNEGDTDIYPIHTIREQIENIVQSGDVLFYVPLVNEEGATANITVTKMFGRAAFDYLCHPYTSSPLRTPQPTSQYSDSSTEWSVTTSASEKEREQGLTPIEIAVVVTASVLIASSCPCILFVLFTKRRKKTKNRTVRPEGGPEEDLPSEISDLSEINTDMDIAVHQAYSTYGETRIKLLPTEAWARAKELTIPAPKRVPEGAWF